MSTMMIEPMGLTSETEIDPLAAKTKKKPESSDSCFSQLMGQMLVMPGTQVLINEYIPVIMTPEQAKPVAAGTQAAGVDAENNLLGIRQQPESAVIAKNDPTFPLPVTDQNEDNGEKVQLTEVPGDELQDTSMKENNGESNKNEQSAATGENASDEFALNNPEGPALRVDREGEQGASGQTGREQQDSNFSGLLQQASTTRSVVVQKDFSQAAQEAREVMPAAKTREVDTAELFDNRITIIKDGTRIAVKMEPEGLGKLDINLSLDKGMIFGRIQVADAGTKNLIENNMQQIMEALLKEGISVGSFSVSLKEGGRQYETPEQSDQHEARRTAEVHDAASVASGSASSASGFVNIFV